MRNLCGRMIVFLWVGSRPMMTMSRAVIILIRMAMTTAMVGARRMKTSIQVAPGKGISKCVTYVTPTNTKHTTLLFLKAVVVQKNTSTATK